MAAVQDNLEWTCGNGYPDNPQLTALGVTDALQLLGVQDGEALAVDGAASTEQVSIVLRQAQGERARKIKEDAGRAAAGRVS